MDDPEKSHRAKETRNFTRRSFGVYAALPEQGMPYRLETFVGAELNSFLRSARHQREKPL
jgi:hypothetical protein